MKINGSRLTNTSASLAPSELSLARPPWVSTTLGSVLIFTIIVDILGNLLVIFSVYRNKKLRNAGRSPLTAQQRGHRWRSEGAAAGQFSARSRSLTHSRADAGARAHAL